MVGYGADADIEASGDVTIASFQFKPLSKHFTYFTHRKSTHWLAPRYDGEEHVSQNLINLSGLANVRADRNRCSTAPEWVFGHSGISVRLGPEWAFGGGRNKRSTNSGIGVREGPEYTSVQ